MDTSGGFHSSEQNTPQATGCNQSVNMHNPNDVPNLTAQLVEAMAMVRALQQQNQTLGAEMRDMRAQMHDERLERRRYMSGEQEHSTPMERSPPPSGSGSQ
jgi:hypothetical protein